MKHPEPSADPPDFRDDECTERFLYGSDAGDVPDEVNDDEHEFDDDGGSDDE